VSYADFALYRILEDNDLLTLSADPDRYTHLFALVEAMQILYEIQEAKRRFLLEEYAEARKVIPRL
jgi:hypothetical protein